MRAMVLTHPGPIDSCPLHETDVPTPTAGPGEVVVRVEACGVCHTDLHQVEGELALRCSPTVPGHQVVGTVVEAGPGAQRFAVGTRVGLAWLYESCGACAFCASGRENLCRSARFTGWDELGGYAEFVKAKENFAYAVPEGLSAEQAAPLLCGGIIGYRALRLSGIEPGGRLGLFGFGNSAHITIQIARHWGCAVYVFTRSPDNQALARRLGAEWAGSSGDDAPALLDAAVIFAPAGELVPAALQRLDKGGTVALAGIYMTDTPPLDYATHLYDEKVLRSVANATRRDGEELLELAARIPIRTETTALALSEAN